MCYASPRISVPMENNFSLIPYPEFETIRDNFFGSVEIHLNPPLKCFQFWKSYIFFLGPESHKTSITFNALWKQFKMANNRKMIDANQRFSFVYNPQ